MCVQSMIMEHQWDKWQPYISTPAPQIPTQQEIDEFRELLERARKYDREHNQPDCEMKEKRQKLLDLAEELGVKIDFV